MPQFQTRFQFKTEKRRLSCWNQDIPFACSFVLLSLFATILTSCMAQQADLKRFQKEFDSRIAKLDRAKESLQAEIVQTRQESQKMLDQQRAELAELVRARAQIKSDLRSLKQEDLSKLSGDMEEVRHELKLAKDEFNQKVDQVNSAVNQEIEKQKAQDEERKVQNEDRKAQIETLATQVDQRLSQMDQDTKKQLEGFRQSLLDFKNTLAVVKDAVVQEEQRALKANQDVGARLDTVSTLTTQQFEKVNQSLQTVTQAVDKATASLNAGMDAQGTRIGELQTKTESETRTLRSDMEETHTQLQEVTQSIAQIRDALGTTGTSLAQQVDAQNQKIQSFTDRLAGLDGVADTLKQESQGNTVQIRELTQSVGQLRDALSTTGTTIGQQVENQDQQLSSVLGRLSQIETQQTAFAQKLDSDTQALRKYLEEDVKKSLDGVLATVNQETKAMATRYDQLTGKWQKLDEQVTHDDQEIQQLSQTVIELRETLDTVGGMLGKRGDDQIQQLGRLFERLNRIEQDQANLIAKQKDHLQAMSSHLAEVNTSVESAVNTVNRLKEQVGTQLADYNRRLDGMVTAQGSLEGYEKDLTANTEHLNELTKTVSQLREVVGAIGLKMGERVDQHEKELSQLMGEIQQIKTATSQSSKGKR